MGMVLWSVEGVPIKVTWDEWFDHFLSKWMESMRNEWIEVNRGEMMDLMDLTLWTLWEWSYESIESVPIKVTWLNPMRMSLSKWMELMRFEWIEVNRTIRGEMSDLKDLMRSTLWESPYGRVKVSLWEWLEWIQWESPYELRMSVPINLTWLISVRKSLCSVEWMSLSNWLGTTLWESPYESREVNPMEVTGMNPMRKSLSKWSESMRNEWIEVNRVNRGEMSDLKDLTWNPFKVTWVNSVGISLWVENECPYQFDLSEPNGNGPMVEWKCPYASDLMWVKMSVPIKMNGIDEIWTRISEMKWNEWIEGFEGFDFVNPMRKSLWSEEGVPMEVTWDEWFDHFLSKWMDSMRNEWIEWNEVNRGEMSELKEVS